MSADQTVILGREYGAPAAFLGSVGQPTSISRNRSSKEAVRLTRLKLPRGKKKNIIVEEKTQLRRRNDPGDQNHQTAGVRSGKLVLGRKETGRLSCKKTTHLGGVRFDSKPEQRGRTGMD